MTRRHSCVRDRRTTGKNRKPPIRGRSPFVAVVWCVAILAGVPVATAAPRTWVASTAPLLARDNTVVGPVSDGRKLWTIELPPGRRALLRSRSIRTGRLVSSVRVDVPRLPGAIRTGDVDDDPGPQLVVGDHVGVVTGTWCPPQPKRDDAGDPRGEPTCVGGRSFYARFSPRTGQAADRKLTAAPRTLLAGRRPSELVRRPGRSSAVRDVVTRRTTLSVPRTAYNVQGAGRFIGWNILSRDETSSRQHVVDRETGRERYSVSEARIARAVSRTTGEDAPSIDFDESTLAPNGAFDVSVYFRGQNFHPAYVDDRGRVHRLRGTFRDLTSYTARSRGNTVLVATDPDGVGAQDPCVRPNAWLSDRTGRTGNTFGAFPPSTRLGLDIIDPPDFVSPTAVLWRQALNSGYRYRVIANVDELPHTPTGRPTC